MALQGGQPHMRSEEAWRKPKQKKSQSSVELLIKLKISNYSSTFESISNYVCLFIDIVQNQHTLS